ELMDKKILTFAERETASKRKLENTSRTTRNQQQQQQHSNKRQNTGRVYTASPGGRKQYRGSKPLCAKCNYHHDGPCAPKCHKCNSIGHLVRDCRVTVNTNNANNQRGTELGQKPTCYECGVKGHYKRECPKLRNNNNQSNQGGRNNVPARVYAIGRAGTDPDANVVTGHGGNDPGDHTYPVCTFILSIIIILASPKSFNSVREDRQRWTCLILSILNKITNRSGLKLLDIIMKDRIIIPSSGEWTLILTMIGSACNTNFRNCLQRHSRGILSKKFPPAAESSAS
nr:hypothetical protein [Tanacetum cinerariifolium]